MKSNREFGQLLMIGVAGPTLSKAEKEFIREEEPAGVIYFRRNIRSPKQLAALSASIGRLYRRTGPPLIGIDQEGGRVYRLTPPFTVFPGNDELGRVYRDTGSLLCVDKQVRAQAKELRQVGINYNFVPVADIDSNPKNPIIGSRAFGSTPEVVSRLAARMIRAYRRERIVSCAKHFPGHGDTFSDSHKKLPVVRAPRALLSRRELTPFKASIRAGVPTIMTAHVIYPAFDSKVPATLSPAILQTVLRRRLGFKGVCVSDDLEMAAIAKHRSIPKSAVQAVAAGVDLLLVCKSLSESDAVLRELRRAVVAGELEGKIVRDAIRRVTRLKVTYLR